ncbi:conjugal transfer protein TrbL [Aeromicrobium sp. PE09-221]|uniref:conjugal transfer protein TrbL n=1 Tax=Aeromicrobium sp. PE09-221 TaxID=1898043 RepID=UPI000B3ECC26|nr:conjugal transfer protein TrbL [Aeromicrobium sp. PE09-221]OUZ07228.1 conjugal transfer protein TrbL [Aeromicrobium sp. PE09-221]
MGVCDIPVISGVCDSAGEAAASLVAAPFEWLASAMGETAGYLIESMWAIFDTTTFVDITSPEYLAVYRLLFGIGIFLVLIFLCCQLILGLIRRDPAALSRAALGAAKAVLGSFLVITLAALALEIVDRLSLGIVQAAGETSETMGDKIAALAVGLGATTVAIPGVGAILTIFLAGLMICAAAIVWLSLLIRKALLLVAIVLAPVALAGATWDLTRGWIGKWLAFVIALIVSKLVLVVIFLVAITQVAAPIDSDIASVADPLAGIALLFIAGFAPYIVYKTISFLGVDHYHATGTEQEAKNALNRPLPIPGARRQGGGTKSVLNSDNNDDGHGKTDTASEGGQRPTPKPSPAPEGTPGSNPETTEVAATAGPATVVVAGAEAVKDTVTAGPRAGEAAGDQAETAADGPTNASADSAPPPPPSDPVPKTPPDPSQPNKE